MKFNKKGQGALEYLLLIGGAVLIAVIVIALLVGMGTGNAATTKERNDEAANATDMPIASIINSVTCAKDKTYVVIWTAVNNKADNKYELLINNKADGVEINAATNPIISKAIGCTVGDTVLIRTTYNGISVLSSPAVVQQ